MLSSEVVKRHCARLGFVRGPKQKPALPLACNLWKHAQPPVQHLKKSAGLQFLCRSPQAVHIAEHALAWTELVLVVTEQENGGAWFQPLRTGGTVCVLASKQPERGGKGKGGGLQ